MLANEKELCKLQTLELIVCCLYFLLYLSMTTMDKYMYA